MVRSESQQGALVATMANCILGCIKHSIANWLKEGTVALHLRLVEVCLKYCVQFWVPQYKMNTQILECVQRKARKMVKGLEGMTDEKGMRILGFVQLTED